tara:strand:- start:8573 stop:8764 length:192 start_codon:yes stop_codon:yes gene_type:complete
LVKINESISTAGWQSGHAAACKAVYAGSIPASASSLLLHKVIWAILQYVLICRLGSIRCGKIN